MNQTDDAENEDMDGQTSANEDRQTKLEMVQSAIHQLPKPQKIVLSMFYLENLSVKEISSVLDISTGTVKSRLFHARENLKNIIIT